MMRRRLAYLLLPLVVAVGACGRRAETQPALQPTPPARSVRPPAYAGRFYPGSADDLRSAVDKALAAARPPTLPGPPVALIVPHAGYEFSAGTAAYAYKALQGLQFDVVVIVGLSHRVPVVGAALSPDDAWATPLGEVPLDREFARALQQADADFQPAAAPHADEHSVEVQLPFLQTVLTNLRIVPVVVSTPSLAECRKLGEALAKVAAGQRVLLIASSDMAHYPPRDDCAKVDQETLDLIKSGDVAGLFAHERQGLVRSEVRGVECTLCGLGAVATVMTAAAKLGATQIVQLHYANSGQVNALIADRSVGYGAVAFCRPKGAAQSSTPAVTAAPEGELTAAQQQVLLTTARQTLEQFVREGERHEPRTTDPNLLARRACFVTLTVGGELRGCIGGLEPRGPLYLAVRDMAIAAASEDPRFPPVKADELPRIHLEISVLSPVREIRDAGEIVVGKHGVIVTQGGRSGVFLPQVAPEQGWDRETMLNHLCAEKAGLPEDAWKTGAQLSVFTAQVFGEGKR
jgi:MEMO1 family protein